MLNLSNITLVAPTGSHIEDTIKAMLYSMQGINFGTVKFVSHIWPKNLPSNIQFCECYPMDTYIKYNRFVFEDLVDYIDTDFCILVQYDGFITNPHLWREEFLQYDYIGAIWPYSEDSYISPQGEHVRVGNGGFTLRSKKLLEAPKKYNIGFTHERGFYNEDGNVCVYNREAFLKAGIKYAPIEVAKYFSHEKNVPEIQGITPFGFHGWNEYGSHFREVVQ